MYNDTIPKDNVRQQRQRVFIEAIISRILLLLAMSFSCAIIPDFHPGDDVLQFNLRLENSGNSSAASNTCFCLQGHACDGDVKMRRHNTFMDDGNACADDENFKQRISTKNRYEWLDQFYSFILPPVTKWDAAHFLTLSVDPWARYPTFVDQATCNKVNGDDTTTCIASTTTNFNSNEYNTIFQKSEQAHAFLPLFPLTIRYAANYLIKAIPRKLLPFTYEATVALTAIIVNMLAFGFAALSLYDLTTFMLMRNDLVTSKGRETNSLAKDDEAFHCCKVAKTAAQLFCINPAGVFFTTAYSESMFAMLTFAGHAVAARGQYYSASALRYMNSGRKSSRLASVYWIPSTFLWTLASYVRSNGTFSSIWWIIIGIGRCCSYIYNSSSTKRGSLGVVAMVMKCSSILLCHVTLATAVAAPVFYHDRRGYRFHCISSNYRDSLSVKPDWCNQGVASAKFSLYTYVQRKHWNVGLLRYFEIKQVPNFILAMPVLILSFCAAARWIVMSWNHVIDCVTSTSKGYKTLESICWWAFYSLNSCSDLFDSKQRRRSSSVSNEVQLLLGPLCLPYYAILAGFALVGTFVAHVQISTRLICSSCPALYWFASALVIPCESRDQTKEDKDGYHLRKFICSYFLLYNALGIIMHVNWLPWT